MSERIETRDVLGASYFVGMNKRRGRMLSHAAVIGPDGRVVRTLCGRVSPLSIGGVGQGEPTCERCLRALRNLTKPRRRGRIVLDKNGKAVVMDGDRIIGKQG